MHTIYKLTKEKRRSLVYLFILVMWALIQYSLGNRFYGLFIIAFFLILAISRQLSFMRIAASVLVIVLFITPTIDTWTKLKQSNLSTFQHPKRPLANIFSPNSGQEVLPVQVQRMLSLLHTHHIASYQLSNQLDRDIEIKQRIIEAAWPIKMDSTSSYLLSVLTETKNNPTCLVIDQNKDIALEYCH